MSSKHDFRDISGRNTVVIICIALGLLGYLFMKGGQRSAASMQASAAGADWIVLEVSDSGKPFRCHQLSDVSLVNEASSDGIYWVANGRIVRISGHYTAIQVLDDDWDGALLRVGLNASGCNVLGTRIYNPVTDEYEKP